MDDFGRRRVGLALGSGSARGLAHIGVIRALEEAGISADVVAGTSIGAVVGAVHAAGNVRELEEAYLAFDWKKVAYFLDVVFPRSGIIDGRKVSEFIREHISTRRIEDLGLSFRAVATDLFTGEEVVLRSGDVIDAVRASFSMPGMFTPMRYGRRVLVDGGLVNPVPVSVARDMGAEVVIAVDLNHDIVAGKGPVASAGGAAGGSGGSGTDRGVPADATANSGRAARDSVRSTPSNVSSPSSSATNGGPGRMRLLRAAMARLDERLRREDHRLSAEAKQTAPDPEPLPGIVDVVLTSLNIMETQITRIRLDMDPPDLLIRPALGSVRFLDFHRAGEIIDAGYRAAKEALAEAPAGWWRGR